MTERKTYFVDVIIPLSIPNRYTYRVPFELNQELELGKRAIVPFGRSKFYTAVISRIHEEIPKDYTAKYIELILDETPIVLPQQFKLWDWISEYYMADIGDVMNAALPSNFKLASETVIVLHPDYEHNSENLNAKAIARQSKTRPVERQRGFNFGCFRIANRINIKRGW